MLRGERTSLNRTRPFDCTFKLDIIIACPGVENLNSPAIVMVEVVEGNRCFCPLPVEPTFDFVKRERALENTHRQNDYSGFRTEGEGIVLHDGVPVDCLSPRVPKRDLRDGQRLDRRSVAGAL